MRSRFWNCCGRRGSTVPAVMPAGAGPFEKIGGIAKGRPSAEELRRGGEFLLGLIGAKARA